MINPLAGIALKQRIAALEAELAGLRERERQLRELAADIAIESELPNEWHDGADAGRSYAARRVLAILDAQPPQESRSVQRERTPCPKCGQYDCPSLQGCRVDVEPEPPTFTEVAEHIECCQPQPPQERCGGNGLRQNFVRCDCAGPCNCAYCPGCEDCAKGGAR